MRVALNLVFLTGRGGGIGRYATELLPALLAADPELELVALHGRMLPADLRTASWAERIEWVDLGVAPDERRNLLAQMATVPLQARRRGCELIHSPANVGPLLAPGLRTVVSVMDLIFLHVPDQWETRRAARTTRLLTQASARRSDRVLAISQATADDLVATFGLPPAKIDVTPLAVRVDPDAPRADERALRERLGAGDRPIVLCVAQKRRYKQQDALVRALADLGDEPVLVLPGAPTDYERELRELAARLGVGDRVLMPGYVSEPELEALYATAACFVLPSLIEGFGLPVLEAMARGVPVACSDRGSLPEVAADAALLFDAADQAAVTGAVRRLLEDRALADALRDRGRARAAEFTWERTAQTTLAGYRRAMT